MWGSRTARGGREVASSSRNDYALKAITHPTLMTSPMANSRSMRTLCPRCVRSKQPTAASSSSSSSFAFAFAFAFFFAAARVMAPHGSLIPSGGSFLFLLERRAVAVVVAVREVLVNVLDEGCHGRVYKCHQSIFRFRETTRGCSVRGTEGTARAKGIERRRFRKMRPSSCSYSDGPSPLPSVLS